MTLIAHGAATDPVAVTEPPSAGGRASAEAASATQPNPSLPLATSRIASLVDSGTFSPRRAVTVGPERYGAAACDGVLAGWGLLAGVPASVYAIDGTVRGGALGTLGCRQIAEAHRLGAARGWPVVGVWHSGGARIPEGIDALDAVGDVFHAIVAASGVVPQISVIAGPCAGGAAYGPALTDITIMTADSYMFVTGPDVIRSVTHESLSSTELGGPDIHSRTSGVCDLVADNERHALLLARDLVDLLGRTGRIDPASVETTPGIRNLLPPSPRRTYDIRPVISALLDPGSREIELKARYAPNVVTTLGRLGGGTVGVLANNPARLGGCLTAEAADKAARFVRMCDAFGVPLMVLVDVPGFLPGRQQEHDGVLRRGAKLLHSFSRSTVPRVTVVLRKAFGGAYISMNARSLGATAVYAWHGAEIDVMGSEAAVTLLHRRSLAAHEQGADRERAVADLAEEHRAAARERVLGAGTIDAFIDPADTAAVVARELASAPAGLRTTGNTPL